MNNDWKRGLIHGIPIALGYLFVSIGFGVLAVRNSLPVLTAVLMSLTNLTSAGQVAAVSVIAMNGTLFEMFATQFIINVRYSLMSVTLSQRTNETVFPPIHRFITAFGVTDEVFAIASTSRTPLTPAYMYGIELLPLVGWTLGTLIGALAGEFLPPSVTNAMGILIYGMFIAIVVPPARENHAIIFAAVVAIGFSFLFHYVLTSVPSGLSIILCAVLASVLAAILFPVKQNEEEEAA